MSVHVSALLSPFQLMPLQCLQLGPYFRHWSLIGTFWRKSENLVPIWSLFYQFGPYFFKSWRKTGNLTRKWLHFVPQENVGKKVRLLLDKSPYFLKLMTNWSLFGLYLFDKLVPYITDVSK